MCSHFEPSLLISIRRQRTSKALQYHGRLGRLSTGFVYESPPRSWAAATGRQVWDRDWRIQRWVAANEVRFSLSDSFAGIGEAVARYLASKGCALLLVYTSDSSTAPIEESEV